MSNTPGVIAFIVFGLSAQAPGNLSELLSIIRAEPKPSSPNSRALAVEAGGAPARAVPRLLELARSNTQQSDRVIAIAALATVTPSSSAIVEFWIQSLKDVANTTLRGQVLSSFRGGSPADPQVISLVIEASKDNDRFVRQEAIAAITKIGRPAIAALPLLTNIRDTDQSLKSSAEAAILAVSKP